MSKTKIKFGRQHDPTLHCILEQFTVANLVGIFLFIQYSETPSFVPLQKKINSFQCAVL